MQVKVFTTVYSVAATSQEVIRLHGVEPDKIAQAIMNGATEFDPQTRLFRYENIWREPDGVIILRVLVDETHLIVASVKVDYD